MARFPSEASLSQETLRQLLATCDQEREQAQVAAEDAQAEVERLTLRNAQLERELTSEKAQHSQLICQFERCHAELLELKNQRHQPIASPLTDQDETTAHIAEELQTTVEELQVTAEELENANAALRITNEDLERRVRERTAELEQAENCRGERQPRQVTLPRRRVPRSAPAAQRHQPAGRQPAGRNHRPAGPDYSRPRAGVTAGDDQSPQRPAGPVQARCRRRQSPSRPCCRGRPDSAPIADYAGPAAAKGFDLRMVPSCGTLWTDDILLERILRNLVENALRYTPSGRVIVGGRRRGAALRIDVLDTGSGIPRNRSVLSSTSFVS